MYTELRLLSKRQHEKYNWSHHAPNAAPQIVVTPNSISGTEPNHYNALQHKIVFQQYRFHSIKAFGAEKLIKFLLIKIYQYGIAQTLARRVSKFSAFCVRSAVWQDCCWRSDISLCPRFAVTKHPSPQKSGSWTVFSKRLRITQWKGRSRWQNSQTCSYTWGERRNWSEYLPSQRNTWANDLFDRENHCGWRWRGNCRF